MADDRLEQLERRIAALEKLVRQLLSPVVSPSALALTDSAEATLPESTPIAPTDPIAPAPPRVLVRPRIDITPTPSAPDRIVDWEQWFGQRGLLAVGVAALLIAAAFFLKYAVDRGWIPPLVRSIAAVIAGIGVAGWGHERIGRGMRMYGASMIGAGGGLVYLGIWAAAGPYALVDRRLGVLLLVATTVAVTLLALHHEIEGLAIWALGGAYLAPIILASGPNPQGFLAYLEVIGLGTAILAYAMSWRATFNLALFGYLLLATAGAAPALQTASGAWLVAAGGVLTLHVTYRRPWPEARLGVLLLTWAAFGVSAVDFLGGSGLRWIALGAVATVFGLLWVQQVARDPFALDPASPSAPLERFLFIVNPIALLILADALQLQPLERASE